MKMHLSGLLVALAIGLTLAMSAVPSAQAQTFTVLYTFSGLDGSGPDGTLLRDDAGNLYGTTYFGGTLDQGVVFKIDTFGTETVVVNGGPAGSFPEYGLIADEAGNFYGLAGGNAAGGGEIVRLGPKNEGKILYVFGACTNCFRPRGPYGGLLRDTSGNLYGVTVMGGVKGVGVECETYGCGTVYKLDTTGTLHVLHAFTGGADGGQPWGALIRDASGNLYGTAITGGDLNCPQFPTLGCGTVFKLAPDGKFTVLHTFTGGADGAGPYGALVADSAGNLYGAAHIGGNTNCDDGCGTLFKIAADGKFSVLYTFMDAADGGGPNGNMVLDPEGNLYGETQGLSSNSYYGTVFKLSPAGVMTILHILNGNTDGADPVGGLIRDSAGNLYGVAYQGFSELDKDGTVFEVTP